MPDPGGPSTVEHRRSTGEEVSHLSSELIDCSTARFRRWSVAGRREFFKGAALGAASLVVTGAAMETEAAPEPPRPGVLLPTEAQAQAEAGAAPTSVEAVRQPASDFMVDVLRKLDFDYAAVNPGSAFAGLHESILSYAGNRKPELLTCLHEEAAIAMAHGYAKAAGKPMLVCVHGTVGLLHGSMALFQAWRSEEHTSELQSPLAQ
jgi:acetolactate synthase I/II/III large subunit